MTKSAKADLQMMYGGAWRQAMTGATMDSFNPATGDPVATVPNGGALDTQKAIDAASAAFPKWSTLTARARAAHLHRVADTLHEISDEVARTITLEEGKPLQEAQNEMGATVDFIRWYADEARRANGAWIPDPVTDRRLLTIKEPVGVCGAIIPWNVPASMITRKAGPALAAGCTMVLKPAEQTPGVACLVARAFLEADLPPGVFNLVTGEPAPIGSALLADERVRKISFTGSTEVGRLLLKGAAQHIKRVSMELGGNAPVIVFADADVPKAIKYIASLKFRNAGQACISANRIFVHQDVQDELTAGLVAHAKGIVVGNGLDAGVTMGPLVDTTSAARVAALVDDAKRNGAKVGFGGKRLTDGGFAEGSYFAPTVLSQLTDDMTIANSEIFGPVASLYSFATEQEVLARANAVPFGLAAYIFTESFARAIRVSEGLEVGMVGVNDIRISAVEAPFGGVKQSGIGREGGAEGLEEYMENKLIALGLN